MKNVLLLKGGSALLNAEEILNRLDIRAGYTVADLGCGGTGHFVAPLARMVGSQGSVYAIDIQKTVLAAVQDKMKMMTITNVTSIWSDLEHYGATPITTGSCDIAVVVNVLFQNTDHASIIREAARMVRPGGRVGVIEWKPVATPFGPPSDVRLTPQYIRAIAAESGLALAFESDAGNYHYLEVFLKMS